MKNQGSSDIIKWQKISVEMMTVWIVMVASSIFSRTEPNIIGFFIWLAIAIGIHTLVRIYFKHQLKYIYLLFLALPLVFIGVLLGFTLIQSATLSGIIAWRMVKHEKDPESETETIVIGISVIVVLISYLTAFYGELSNGELIIWMLIIQIFFLVFGKLLHNLVVLTSNQNITKNSITVTSVLALTFGTASLLYVSFPLIRKAFYLIVNSIISVFTFLLAPLFNWVETIEPEAKEGEIEEQEWEDRGQEKQDYSSLDSEPAITSEHILVAFLILVAIIILFIIFKNREQLLSKINFTKDQSDLVSDSGRINDRKFWKRHKHNKAPNNDIRKAFYKLEKWASHHELGRYFDESIEDWLRRYELTGMIDEKAINIYRDVRYGGREAGAKDKKHYFEQINELKKFLKQTYITESKKDTQ